MTNTIQKLKTILSEEGDKVTFIKTEGDNIIFSSFEPYEETTIILTCIPFTTDEGETGYAVEGVRDGHYIPDVTTIHAEDLI
jgi:hypothetical protein